MTSTEPECVRVPWPVTWGWRIALAAAVCGFLISVHQLDGLEARVRSVEGRLTKTPSDVYEEVRALRVFMEHVALRIHAIDQVTRKHCNDVHGADLPLCGPVAAVDRLHGGLDP